MTSHLENHTTTDVKCYEVSKPEIEFQMMIIIYMALHMHTHTERLTFHAKTTSEKLYMYKGVGARKQKPRGATI